VGVEVAQDNIGERGMEEIANGVSAVRVCRRGHVSSDHVDPGLSWELDFDSNSFQLGSAHTSEVRRVSLATNKTRNATTSRITVDSESMEAR
jgi:hypothetical protein